MRVRSNALHLGIAVLVSGCGEGAATTEFDSLSSSDATSAGGADDGGGVDTGTSEGMRLDTPGGDGDGDGGPVSCTVTPDEGDAPPPCIDSAPADSFSPDVQWAWSPTTSDTSSVVTPLVINLDDDNMDGAVDLCDTPDVIVVTYDGETAWPAQGGGFEEGHLNILDGATGTRWKRVAENLDHTITPAVGDVDGDGLPEIVAASRSELFVFDNLGEIQSRKPSPILGQKAIALADLDNDGTVEIVVDRYIFDSDGDQLVVLPRGSATATPVDLDGDGDLEVVEGFSAWHHDGTMMWDDPGGVTFMTFTAVADLDGDGLPEVVGSGDDGIVIFEHDGVRKIDGGGSYRSPPAIVDIDGNGTAEIAAVSMGTMYHALDVNLGVLWSAAVADGSGAASGTAFDFLGDGSAETMYADETQLFAFDPSGSPELTVPRTSWTQTEYPVVADVDNDGSAEIVVVSNIGYMGQTSPTVQVIRDADDRWIPARRIWNQHAYHVTNVLEDGRIPQNEAPNWETYNTFRVNAQILGDGSSACIPPVD
jgi:hypothetical protein